MSTTHTWLAKTDEELYREIGQALAADQRQAIPIVPKRLIADGKAWLDKNVPRLLKSVCTNATIRRHAAREETQLVFDGLCEAIVHITAQVPAGCVAAYLVRRGITALCASHWKDSSSL